MDEPKKSSISEIEKAMDEGKDLEMLPDGRTVEKATKIIRNPDAAEIYSQGYTDGYNRAYQGFKKFIENGMSVQLSIPADTYLEKG